MQINSSYLRVHNFPVQYRNPYTDYINNTIYERAKRARKFFGVYRDFGQCTGENGSSVQGYYSNRLAGMQVLASKCC